MRRSEHNGYPVAYVPRRWSPCPAAVDMRSRRPVAVLPRYDDGASLRELGPLSAEAELVVVGVRVLGSACTCGWRSPRMALAVPIRWPLTVELHLRTAALERLWCAHAARVDNTTI